ncbi:MAG: cytidylate kinase-like family protein [Deltaproteobacteria bacterium]|nr:cytidylate kinase-like family protein [Deltaproteobacteria bacterium]
MSIIIISSDSYEKGEEIAHNAARALDYACLDRELLAVVAARYGIPQDRLEWALESSPSSWGRSARLQDRCLAYMQSTTLGELLKDNTVCHGLAAHLYVVGISHALRVRILAEPVELAREISGEGEVPPERAPRFIDRQRKLRQHWSLTHYQLDETDPSQYDLVISLSQIHTDEAIKIIAQTAGYRRFAPMTYSLRCIKDAELASRVRAGLLEAYPKVKVRAEGGTVIVETQGSRRNKLKKAAAIKEEVQAMEGVDYVEVHIKNGLFKRAP